MRTCLVLLLVASFGCAGRNSGPEGWRKVSSAHFDVMTPIDSDDARQTALELERFRAALLARWKRPEAATRRLRVVVYPDMAEFREHRADKFEGFARPSDGLIVEAHRGFTQEGLGLAKTITHELAHQIDAAVLLRQPRWLNEGLAEYLSTVTIEEGKARFGRASYEDLMNARYIKPLSLDELWGWDEKDPPSMSREDLNRYYVDAWLWVTFLDNERGDRFDDFLARLSRAEAPRAAFRAAFAGLSEDQLQHEISEFLTRIFPTNAVAMRPLIETLTESALSVAGVHALEAEVWEAAPSEEPQEARDAFVKQELAAALAADPNDLDALVLQARRAPEDEQASLARALTEKAPADPRGWTLLADALGSPAHDERLHAVERALATGPADPEALVAAARFVPGAEDRVRYAEKAVALIPFDVGAVAVLARAQAQNGQCDAAKTSADRAVDLVGENAPAAERRRIADWLQKSIAGCHRP